MESDLTRTALLRLMRERHPHLRGQLAPAIDQLFDPKWQRDHKCYYAFAYRFVVHDLDGRIVSAWSQYHRAKLEQLELLREAIPSLDRIWTSRLLGGDFYFRGAKIAPPEVITINENAAYGLLSEILAPAKCAACGCDVGPLYHTDRPDCGKHRPHRRVQIDLPPVGKGMRRVRRALRAMQDTTNATIDAVNDIRFEADRLAYEDRMKPKTRGKRQ